MHILSALLISLLVCVPSLGASSAETMRELWKATLQSLPEYPDEQFEGKGIVIPAGGEYYLINAWVCVNALRYQGCSLPIEIWYIGEQEYIPHFMEMLEGLGAKCCDITKVFDYPIKGFEVKAHAVLASGFQEVMLIDADNVVMADPEFLFSSSEYVKTGALFWPDCSVMQANSPLWGVLDLKPRYIRAQESGQLVIDKKRCWKAVNLCKHMNQESHYYYRYMYGDKDSFFLSCLATNTPYTMMKYLPGLVERIAGDNNFTAFIQRDPLGNPLFCHSVLVNWAERTNYDTLWHYYTLPEQLSSDLDPVFPWRDPTHYSFRAKYKHLEKMCIGFLKEVLDLGE